MFVLTTLCEAGDQKSCQRVMNEIRAGTDELTRQGRIIAWAHAKSGMGEKSEGVIVLLSAVQEGMKRGESSRDLRNYLYAAEAIARGNPDLEQRVQAFRNQANI